MTNTILINSDKTLEKTVFRPIYQSENKADIIQFLIDESYCDDISNCTIVLQALIPSIDEEGNPIIVGKLRYMTLDEEQYKGMWRTELPITTTLTQYSGSIKYWFLVFNTIDVENIVITKTDCNEIEILPTPLASSVELSKEPTYDILSNLTDNIAELKSDKLDTRFDFDEEAGTIQFYANGEKLGLPIKVDNEVEWQGWD